MQNNYWETVSSICCPECGHLFPERADICPFCDGPHIYNCAEIKALDQIGNTILFEDEKYFDEITFGEGF